VTIEGSEPITQQFTVTFDTVPANTGVIVFDGTNYIDGAAASKDAGAYSITANAASGYTFTRWEVDGGLSLANSSLASTTCTLSGNGTLRMVQTQATTPPPTTPPPTTPPPTTTSPTTQPPRQGCIIATAAYGSPMDPEVAHMRHVRDDLIGSSKTGRVLVDRWNAFYYSWSSPVAKWIRESDTRQAAFRILLSPLLGVIHLTELTYTSVAQMNVELASVVAFAVASFLSVMAYVVVPTLAIIILGREVLELFLKFNSLQDSTDNTKVTLARLQVHEIEGMATCPVDVNTSESPLGFLLAQSAKRSSLHVGRR
jgi:hypothetical protein